MSAKTYTQEQILRGIRVFWREPPNCEFPFDPDTLLEELFQLKYISESDLYEFLDGLEEFFGFTCPREEWQKFFGWPITDPDAWARDVGPRLTLARLADFIRERAEPILLEPLTLLGKPCLTAGIFRGLERLMAQINPQAQRFAPSTPICACLRGFRLHHLWDRLRWITEERIPAPRRIQFGCGGFYFKVGIGLSIALWTRDLEGLWLSLKVTALLFVPTAIIVEFLNSWINPLPKEIETFGDLARYLAVILIDQQPECS